MAGDLVTGVRDSTHERGDPFGEPSEHEERRVHLVCIEDPEKSLDVAATRSSRVDQLSRVIAELSAETWK